MVLQQGVVLLVESVRIVDGDERGDKFSQEIMLRLGKWNEKCNGYQKE